MTVLCQKGGGAVFSASCDSAGAQCGSKVAPSALEKTDKQKAVAQAWQNTSLLISSPVTSWPCLLLLSAWQRAPCLCKAVLFLLDGRELWLSVYILFYDIKELWSGDLQYESPILLSDSIKKDFCRFICS